MSIAERPQQDATNNLPAVPAKREIRVVEDHGPLAHLMDSARFEHLQRIASVMASAGIIPDHLRGTKQRAFSPQEILGNCFKIVNQSLRWGFDPFAVMDETYVVGGKLGYQGKLVAAVINARAGLIRPLQYEHSGTADGRTVKVIGQFVGEDEPRTITLSVAQAKTANEMWKKDPDQKLCYSGATKWARRHSPETIMGVLTDDDLERMQENRAAGAQALDTRPRTLEQLGDRLRNTDPAGGGHVVDEATQQTDREPHSPPDGLLPGERIQADGEIVNDNASESSDGIDSPAPDDINQDSEPDEPQLSPKMLGIKRAFDSCTAVLQSSKIRDQHNPPDRENDSEEARQIEAWHKATVDRVRAARGENSNA